MAQAQRDGRFLCRCGSNDDFSHRPVFFSISKNVQSCLCQVLVYKAKADGNSFSQTWLKSTECSLCYKRIVFLSLPSTTRSEIPPWMLCVSERAKFRDGNAGDRKCFCVAHQPASLNFQRDLIRVKFNPVVNEALTFLPKLSNKA